MHFMTQLGVLAIILIILVILIKSNQTLEQIYMEGEPERETISIPAFRIPKRPQTTKKEPVPTSSQISKKTVERSANTIPVEIIPGWYIERIDRTGRREGRTKILSFPFAIGRAADNDYVIDDLSVSGHHACVEEENGQLELVDLGSLNKILFGGRPVGKVNLTDRMEVSLGNTRIRFCKEESVAQKTFVSPQSAWMEEWY